ncbi:MAG: HD domain-containing protein [Bacteroidetes bacterium]|nr:HD domain-containing protein [Bacteroidota bacterium]
MNLKEAIKAEIFSTLQICSEEIGVKAYVIGGFVRDYLLKRHSKDIDVVVVGRGIDLAKKLAQKPDSKDLVVYENFGTAMVRHKDFEIEFVGARKESYRRDSRKPIVEEGTLQDDQLRRDFTINALSISLNKENYGEVIDPFDGVADLQNKIIRTPLEPGITFSDDPLRMMRAIRFATQLDFTIEPETLKAIQKHKNRIKIVSQERITTELNKIILAPIPSIGFRLMESTGLLQIIFPELEAMKGVDVVNGQGHKDNFYHTIKVLDNVAEHSDNLWLRWVAILHDIAKPQTKRFDPQNGWTFHGHEDRGARMVPKIFRQLKLPMNENMKYVQNLVKLHQRPIALVNEEVSDSAIRRIVFEAGEDLNDLLDFCRSDITSKNLAKVKRFKNNYAQLEARIREVEERDNLRNWQPPVTGDMIMEAFGLKPGRIIGQIKTEIREAILDGLIPNDPERAIAYMHEIAPKYLKQD